MNLKDMVIEMLYIVMGKSSSGKDSIYSRIMSDKRLSLLKVITYTTRPMREGENEGVEYHFTDEDNMKKLELDGKVIEKRCYNTVYGPWYYFTVDDGAIDIDNKDYMMIGTLESYESIRNYYGSDRVFPIYVEVENGERLQRALNREKTQKEPKYAEMCRRFLADEEDFCEENLEKLDIHERFENVDIEKCIKKINEKIAHFRN